LGIFYSCILYIRRICYYFILLTLFKKKEKSSFAKKEDKEWPEICLFITAYNEKPILADKINKCFSLDYPKDKLKIVFVTDGSDDGSYEYRKISPV
jgi:cellulose synthase/poly-beta-1,6-N-acetylglucosamine synthase-like glycosyltransferase